MLRNLTSENQQLREQNQFMRNLYGNNPASGANLPSMIQTPTSTRAYKKEATESPRKRLRLNSNRGEESPITSSDNEKSVHNVRFTVPEIAASKTKSPRKYSPHINKLLASPKRITRSSVIQQNLAYSSPPQASHLPSSFISPHNQTPSSQILESPSRRSLRLMEKDHQLTFETPPTSKFTDLNCVQGQYTFPSYFYTSPSSKSKLNYDMNYHHMMLTPEALKMIPPRSAKRSLDAIIHAIDQIEKT